MTTSRSTVRDALKTLFTTKLVGSGLPVKTVTDSNVKTLAGLTPLVAILSAGTHRDRVTFMGAIPKFYLEVQVWVLQSGTGWTNAQAEDALDSIEALISEVYAESVGTANWSAIENDGRSTVVEVTSDGRLYFMERIPTVVNTVKS